MTDATDTDVALQPALPSLELPDFEGITPVGVVTKVNGTGQRISRALHLEERGVLVIEYEVANVGHSLIKDGVHRLQTLSVRDMYELPGKPGKRLLVSLREAYRKADDARHNRLPITDGVGTIRVPAGFTDEHGNVLDEEALAEIRGEEFLASLNDPGLDPVVVEFGDGSRRLWPEDFSAGDPRPVPGEFVDGELQVRRLLDDDSGETVAEWTDEDEDARLVALEAEALAEEAAGNRAAVDELLAGRERARAEGEPWSGYELSSAKEIRDRIGAMADRDAVFGVAEWEEEHGGRKTILEAAGRRAAELMEAGE
jgi:hypothetical protein